MTQPGTAGTDDDPLDSIATDQLVVNGEVIDTLVGLAFDSANASDGVLRFDGTGSTNGITDGSAKVLVGGTVYDVAGGEWVDFSGTSHTLDSWEKVINAQFNVTITGTNGPVTPGNTLDVTADVTNNGTDSDTQTVTLDIDNSVGQVDSTSVTLSGGGSVTKTLSWAVPSGQTAQDYQATVSSADDSATQTVTVESAVPASLISHWTFDSADTSGSTAIDTVGSNDGTISGATTGVSGANQTYTTNEAYSFDGNGDYVDLGEVGVEGSGDFSLFAWVKPSSDGQIFANGSGSANDSLAVEVRNGQTDLFVNINSGGAKTTASGVLNNGSWSHVGFVNDTTNGVQLYADGSQVATGGTAGSLNTTPATLKVGDRGDALNPLGGDVDDVRAYGKALTDTEASNLYNNGRI